MKLDLEIVNPLKHKNWDELLLSADNSSFFHTAAWARVLNEAYRYTPFYLTRSEFGKLSVLLAMMEVKSRLTGARGVSLPFTDSCSVIANGGEKETLFRDAADFGKKRGWRSLEFRNGGILSAKNDVSEHYIGHELDLSQGETALFKSFRESTRRNIKKSQKMGVSVVLANTGEQMEQYYRLHCLTRKKHGLPPQPKQFFDKILRYIIRENRGILVIASYKNKIIAGAVFFHFGGRAIYKYGGSDDEYQHLRANNLVMWRAIQWYAENGHTVLSFGRTDPGNEGLIRYKCGWGTEQTTIIYYKYDLRYNSFVKAKCLLEGYHNIVFSSMPNALSRGFGSLLYKHIG